MGKDSTQSQTSGGCQQEAALDVEWREETRDSFFFVLKYLFKMDYHELPCSPIIARQAKLSLLKIESLL